MTEETETVPFYDGVTQKASIILQELLKELELKGGDRDYEAEVVANTYARLIICVYMGFQPKLLASDAEESAFKLMELTGIEMEKVEADDAD